jgi:tape measure domain-containing protein
VATADEIERIIVEIESQGADKAYVGIKRIDDVMNDLSKKKPIDFLEGFNALDGALSKSLVDLPNMAKLADQAGAAIARVAAETRRYSQAQANKSERNSAFEAARRDAQQLAEQMRAANRIPTNLQAGANPKAIDYAAALAEQSQKAGSAIEAASHSAMEEAVAIGQAAKNASKLSSVYDVIEKRAKAASKADSDWLADKMRAANRIPQELRETPKALSVGQKAVQSFARAFGPRATQGLMSTVGMLEKIGPIASKIGPPVASAALAVGAIGLAGVGAAVWAGKEFGGAVIGAQAFREDMVSALETIAGTEAKAQSIIDVASKTASFLGKKKVDTVGQFTTLLGKGFDVGMADDIVKGMADLKVKAPTANVESLVFAISQIKSKGKLAGEELMQLAEAGLDRGGVMAILAKKTGKSMADVEKDMQAGKISAIDGIKAILGSINKNGDPLGSVANKKSRNNITDLLDRVKSIPEDILFDLKVGKGMDATKGVLNSVLDFFDTDSGKGKEVRQVGADLFNAMVEGLTGNKVDTSKGITGTLDAILAGAKEAVPVVKDLATGARDMLSLAGIFMSAAGAVREFAEPLGGISTIWKTLTLPLRAMASMIMGPLVLLPELYSGFKAISSVFDGSNPAESFSEMWESIKTSGASIINEGMNLGANLWQGLVQGITGGIGMVTAAATGLANAALGAVGITWRVGSPAKAFEDQSLWAAAGAVRGFNKGTPGVATAAGGMATAALGASYAAGQANMNGGASVTSMSGGAGAGFVINFSPTIIVSGASSPAQAQAAGAAAVRGSREAFEAQIGSAMRRVRYG